MREPEEGLEESRRWFQSNKLQLSEGKILTGPLTFTYKYTLWCVGILINN